MDANPPVLHMLCGKIASGKSSLAARLGRGGGAIILAEDTWLTTLFADQMTTLADYSRCTGKLRTAMGPHVMALLNAGVSVVLDFQANTVEARDWMRGILEQTGARHVLHVLEVPDSVCLERLHARNARGDHPFAATEAQFRQISRHFNPPSPEEGFNIEVHS